MRELQARGLIVIPSFNEAQSIGEVLAKIQNMYSNDFDIVVINDGSKDYTAEIVKSNGVKVISHSKNLGVVAAIQTGRAYALKHGYDFMIMVDADGQHDPLCIKQVADPLVKGEADFVIGSRELGQYISEEPFVIRIARKLCAITVSVLVGRLVMDSTSGFKGWNLKAIRYFYRIYATSKRLHHQSVNDIEEILLASKNNYRIVEVPVRMFDRLWGETKCYNPEALLRFPVHLLQAMVRSFLMTNR